MQIFYVIVELNNLIVYSGLLLASESESITDQIHNT